MSEKDELPPNSESASELKGLRVELQRIRELLEQQEKRSGILTWRPSLRTFFLLTAVAAAWFSWLSYEIQFSNREKAAAQELARLGATVTSRPSQRLLVATLPGRPSDPPAPLRHALGRDLFVQMDALTIQQQLEGNAKERFLAALRDASSLRSLRVYRTQLTTDDLAPVWKMSGLKTLQLYATRLSRGPLIGIEELPLESFDASHTLMDDQAIASLAECENLVSVKLTRTSITDVGLMQLSKLENLSELRIRRCPISLKAVQAFSKLRPNCFIDYEPLMFDGNGNVDAASSRLKVRQFGPRRRGSYRVEAQSAYRQFGAIAMN